MEDFQRKGDGGNPPEAFDVRSAIRDAITEFMTTEQAKAEPAYKTELLEERKRREQLENRVNELIQENRKARTLAEEAERNAAIRTELQRLGVTKIDLAYKAVKDDIGRNADGALTARGSDGEVGLRDYLKQFVGENPELLPARISGGSGVTGPQRPIQAGAVDLDRIKPGMSPEELDRVRQEIARIASQSSI